MSASAAALEVRELVVGVRRGDASLRLVRGASFAVAAGRTLCLVGESGSGKTLTALALMRLLPRSLGAQAQQVLLEGQPVSLAGWSGPPAGLAMIFQEPMTALNPAFTVGSQIGEALRIHHRGMGARQARAEALRLLEEVGIADAAQRLQAYPHQMSGGMRQRVVIAIALACAPRVLIADEPTTALDVTVQAQILRLFRQLQQMHRLGLVLVTHDMGVVSAVADDVAVMYAGQVVEQGPAEQVLGAPLHPYTRALLACTPAMPSGVEPPRPPDAPLAEIPGVVPLPAEWGAGCTFAPRCPQVRAECSVRAPRWVERESGRGVACWLHEERP